MLILNIIKILTKHSSRASPLTQSEILDYLNREFFVRPDRKTLRTTLNTLTDQYEGAHYSESGRKGWYIDSLLSENEGDSVMRALLFSDELSRKDIDNISEKLWRNPAFMRRYRNVVRPRLKKRKYFDNELIDLIIHALDERKMLIFSLCIRKSGTSTELEREPDGFVREYLIRPISILAHGGGFSLLGSLGDSARMKFFPLERICGARLSEVECTVMPQFSEGNSIYPENSAEVRFPRGGARSEIVVKANREALLELQSAFHEISSQPISETLFEVKFICNLSSAKRYLLTLGDGVEVVSPSSLRGEVAAIYFRMAARYRA